MCLATQKTTTVLVVVWMCWCVKKSQTKRGNRERFCPAPMRSTLTYYIRNMILLLSKNLTTSKKFSHFSPKHSHIFRHFFLFENMRENMTSKSWSSIFESQKRHTSHNDKDNDIIAKRSSNSSLHTGIVTIPYQHTTKLAKKWKESILKTLLWRFYRDKFVACQGSQWKRSLAGGSPYTHALHCTVPSSSWRRKTTTRRRIGSWWLINHQMAIANKKKKSLAMHPCRAIPMIQ